MNRSSWVGSFVLVVLGTASPALAGNLLLNGSFESASQSPGGGFITLSAVSTVIDDWTVETGSVDYIGGYWQAQDGSRSIDLSGNSEGLTSQSFATILGQTYYVSFWMAGNPDGAPTVKTLEVSAVSTLPAGTSSQQFTFDTTGTSKASMGWEQKTWSFVATGTPTALKFKSLSGAFYGPALDNVSVTTVPLPPTAWMGIGLLGAIGAVKRLRRQRQAL